MKKKYLLLPLEFAFLMYVGFVVPPTRFPIYVILMLIAIPIEPLISKAVNRFLSRIGIKIRLPSTLKESIMVNGPMLGAFILGFGGSCLI